jgi:hypothetical protein
MGGQLRTLQVTASGYLKKCLRFIREGDTVKKSHHLTGVPFDAAGK